MYEYLGWLFCEVTFHWFDLFDVPFDEREWRWYHRANYAVGRLPYRLGCWCYDQGGV
jgi:hypothetical protein